jgi:hypothetical protein
MSQQDNYTNVLLEDINSKFDAVMEIVSPLTGLPVVMSQLQSDIDEVKSDVKVIKAVLTEDSGQLKNHERRIIKLEATT